MAELWNNNISVKSEPTQQECGTEKFRVSNRNCTHDLPNTWWALYPLSYQTSWRVRSFNWVHMWQVSCILLGLALSKSLCRMSVMYELGWMTLLSMSPCSSVDRASAQCLRGHVFHSCQWLKIFLCPMLVSCRSIYFSHFITNPKIHHLYSLTLYQ